MLGSETGTPGKGRKEFEKKREEGAKKGMRKQEKQGESEASQVKGDTLADVFYACFHIAADPVWKDWCHS